MSEKCLRPSDVDSKVPMGEWCELCSKLLKLCLHSFEPGEDDPKKIFSANFHFIGWNQWSIGLSICPTIPNIELHLPFGFIRIGLSGVRDLPTGVAIRNNKLPRMTISNKKTGFGFGYW